MAAALVLWSHALAALLFGMLALAQWRGRVAGLPRRTFVVALAATAIWLLAVAGIDTRDVVTRVLESARNLAWLGFMFALVRRGGVASRRSAVAAVYGVVAFIVAIAMVLGVAEAAAARTDMVPALSAARLIFRMMAAVSALVLVHHLHAAAAAPRVRSGVALVVAALGTMWAVDLGLYTATYVTARWPIELIAVRGVAMVVLAPVLALAAHRSGDWTLQLSRTVAWQSLSAIGLALYVGAMLLATSLIGAVGGEHARVVQTAFVFGSTTALITVLSTPWLRAWAKVKLAKHLFRHRYDYRAEWVRFTDTLGRPGDAASSLDRRVVKAVADLTDSPAGVLLVPGGGSLEIGAAWNWDADALSSAGGDAALASYLATTARIVELDAVRGGSADAAELACIPVWMTERAEPWALVPLVHFGQLTGAILLARPPVDRALDWEDFDLLRIAGRQVASYLAEDRAHDALAEARRFDEFNRRFAFILHDIKNLVSQLSLVARNAERHADNPAFRRDMVATLTESAERMNALLAKLSQQHRGRGEDVRAVDVMPLIERVAASRRAQHPIATGGTARPLALADPARLEQLLGHLVQNAIEASPTNSPVSVTVSMEGEAVAIDVVDCGCGMSAAFVRDQLFKPFVSSKDAGFGIGAFEARQLATAMGGAIEVTSREGEGTRFRVRLRGAPAATLEAAA